VLREALVPPIKSSRKHHSAGTAHLASFRAGGAYNLNIFP